MKGINWHENSLEECNIKYELTAERSGKFRDGNYVNLRIGTPLKNANMCVMGILEEKWKEQKNITKKWLKTSKISCKTLVYTSKNLSQL